MDLMLLLSGLKRNGAKRIHVVLTYNCYMRMDRPVGDYKATSGSDVLQYISFAGADSIHIFESHSEILLAAVPLNVFCRNLSSFPVVADVVDLLGVENLVIVSPDLGAVKRCKEFVKFYRKERAVELDVAIMDKTRTRPNEVESVQLVVGSVDKKRVLFMDDMIDTGVNSAEHLVQIGRDPEKDGRPGSLRLRHPRRLLRRPVLRETAGL